MSPGEFAEDMQKRGDGFLAMFTRMMGSSIATKVPKGTGCQNVGGSFQCQSRSSRCGKPWRSSLRTWRCKWLVWRTLRTEHAPYGTQSQSIRGAFERASKRQKENRRLLWGGSPHRHARTIGERFLRRSRSHRMAHRLESTRVILVSMESTQSNEQGSSTMSLATVPWQCNPRHFFLELNA